MAAFDPDAYLAQKPAAAPLAFDPDAYLAASAPRKTGTAADQIPGYGGAVPAATTPAAPARTSMLDKLRGGIETGATLASGAVTAPVIEASKIYGALTSGQFGTPEGIRAGERMGQQVAGQIQYQPRTAAGQEYSANVANAMAQTGLQGVPLNVLADFQRGAVPAIKAGVQTGRDIQAGRAAKTAEAQSAADWARAPQIEAAQAAQRLGIAVNPAETNPNVKTKMLVGATGEAVVNAKAVKANLPKWNEVARKDLGLPENTPLTAESFEKSRAPHYQPYEEIRKMGVLQASDDVLNDLSSLKLDPLSTSNPEKAMKVNGVVDRTLGQVAEGLNGDNVVGQIRGFRKDATRVLKNPNSSPIDIDVAEAQIGIASALENLIEANVKDPKTLDRLRNARQAIAKSHDWERATGVTTQQVDPLQIAKMAEKGAPLTGVLADVAKVAGNFPEIASTNVAKEPLLYQRLRRGGAGGTIGFAFGGGPVGAAIGAGLTSLGSEGMANVLARPGVQNRMAIPADRRIPFPVEPTAPVPPIPQNRAVVPYQTPVEVLNPGEGAYFPNFQKGAEPTFGAEPTRFANALLPNEVPRQIYEAQKRAEMAQEFRAAAERKPARGGVDLVFDAAGNLVPAPTAGASGVMPSALESAVAKMSGQVIEQPSTTFKTQTISPKTGAQPYTRITKREGETTFERGVGQAFNMTAEEKIAWNKAKADLAEVVPGMRTLSDKAVAAKMMDREWIQEAVTKAKQKMQMLDEAMARSDNLRLRQDAAIKREQLQSTLETLEEQYRKARPVKRGGQGPKTREFQRNMLAPEQEIQNALADRPVKIDLTGMAK